MKPLTRTKYEEEIRRLRRENVRLSEMILAKSPQCECERLRKIIAEARVRVSQQRARIEGGWVNTYILGRDINALAKTLEMEVSDDD